MTKEEIWKLAERYQKRADNAYTAFQESGITRYDTAYRNYDDLANALRIAASASADHAQLVQLKGMLADFAALAKSVQEATGSRKQELAEKLAKELLAHARMTGLVGTDRLEVNNG